MDTNRILSLSLGLAVVALSPAFAGCMANAQDAGEEQAEPGAGGADAITSELGDESGDENTGETEQAETSVTLQPFQTVTAPTWWAWGWTHVDITNSTLNQGGYVSLQAGAAAPEYVWVNPATRLCTAWSYPVWCITSPTTVSVARQWGGLPVHVTNVSSIPFGVRIY